MAYWSKLLNLLYRFYDKAHKIDALEFFKKFAVSAEELPDTVSDSTKLTGVIIEPALPGSCST